MHRAFFLAMVLFMAIPAAEAHQPWPVVDDCVPPELGLRLVLHPGERVVLCPGHFHLPAAPGQVAVSITGEDAQVLCAATVLDGADGGTPSLGTALQIDGSNGLTLTGCTVKAFRTGLVVSDSEDVVVAGHTFTGLYHDADLQFRPEGPYDCGWCQQYNWNNINRSDWVGGAVRIVRSTHVSVTGNLMGKVYNGVEAFKSSAVDVSRNRITEATDWGIRFYDADDGTIHNNHISKVSRWMERHGCPQGCPMDSAGILFVSDSDGNRVTHNEILDTWGASGFFLGNEGTLPLSSDDNYIADNRVVHGAVGNAFEMTFGQGNVLEHNIADDYATGVWPTYSRGYVIRHNIVRNTRWHMGLALINVDEAQVLDNLFADNPDGIYIKTEEPPASWGDVPQQVRGVTLSGNTITGGNRALVFATQPFEDHPWFTEQVKVARNQLGGASTGIRFERRAFEPGGRGLKLAENNLDITVLRVAVDNRDQAEDLVLPRNWWASFSTPEIEAHILDQQDNPAWGDIDPNVLAVAPWLIPAPPGEAGIGNVEPYPPSWPIVQE